ncbi:MAG: TonB-dependent receptor [Acidobacteria bacterium]|nr:TonB-dependent receptor [Acidobacteriota bacterium]
MGMLVALPAAGLAQGLGEITGVVRDDTGAVLPGVTVEAASPALIEQVRTGVTDGSGQYRIVSLRPGTYSVTFTLPGFTTVRQQGIQIAGAFTATVNAAMQIGGVNETITVAGAAPIVDVQEARAQRTIDSGAISAVPTGRMPHHLATLVPGVVVGSAIGGPQDTGGSRGDPMALLSAHGSRASDQRVRLDGLATNNDSATGARTGFLPNMTSTQELVVDVGASNAENATGGVQINLIPREGGNELSGTVYAMFANESLQGDNVTDDLRTRGLALASSLKSMYDFNPGVGGPFIRDRLWFYFAGRVNKYDNYVGGQAYINKNAGDPTRWTYEPDLTQPNRYIQEFANANGRLTWQANSIHKFAAFYQWDYRCQCPRATNQDPPEAQTYFRLPLQRVAQATWSAPFTNRVLAEVGVGVRTERWMHANGPAGRRELIGVQDQGLGITYRNGIGNQPYATSLNQVANVRGSVTYVTGAHVLKVGVDYKNAWREHTTYRNNAYNMDYRFQNGVPNRITLHASPYVARTESPIDLGLFLQEKWTRGRLTLNLGVRYEHYEVQFPEQSIGESLYTPGRSISFPAQDLLSWNNIQPRLGMAYDLFGDGRTAVKASFNQYMEQTGVGTGTIFGNNANPIFAMTNHITRSWRDADGDYWPDCDQLNPLANGECGPYSDLNFGNVRSTINYDPETLSGWNSRPYNYEWSLGLQRQLVSGLAVDFSFFERWFGNQPITDNLAATADDFDQFTITAPNDPRLPNGGGYTLGTLYNVKPAKFGQVQNQITFAKNFGKYDERWRGFDIGVNSRLQNGLLLQGGLSTGRKAWDTCEVRAVLPETDLTDPWCNYSEAFQTHVTMMASYVVPNIDVQFSAAYQNRPGPAILGNYVASNAVVAPSLGRNLSGGSRNVTVPLIAQNTELSDRVNQLDLRFGKVLRFGGVTGTVAFDLYNVFNQAVPLSYQSTYARFLQVSSITPPLLGRLTFELSF